MLGAGLVRRIGSAILEDAEGKVGLGRSWKCGSA